MHTPRRSLGSPFWPSVSGLLGWGVASLAGAWLSACGSAASDAARGGSHTPSEEARAHTPRLSIESGGLRLMTLGRDGRVRVGVRALGPFAAFEGPSGFEGAGASVSALVDPQAMPSVTFEGFTLRGAPGGAKGEGAWVRGHVPSYDPPVGGACDVGPELAALDALFAGGDAPTAGISDALTGTGSACRTKAFLACFFRVWNEPSPVEGRRYADLWAEKGTPNASDVASDFASDVEPDVAFALAQAAQSASRCAGKTPTVGQGVTGGQGLGGSFAVSATSLLFSPSPLLSLSIYAGVPSSYDDALVNATPVAFVAVPESCTTPGGLCVVSPWPLTRCKGCDALVRGQTYTAFLLEKAGQLHRDVKRVPFVR